MIKLPPPNPNLTTTDVLEIMRASGKLLHRWGQAVDGTPILSVQTGGNRQPPIFVTAGAHSHEPAGVLAALALLQRLETEHEVHILPLRDPMGFAGANHCLSVAAGVIVEVTDHRDALAYLQAHAQPLSSQGDLALFRLGDVGFLWNVPTPGSEGSRPMAGYVQELARREPAVTRPLWGKPVMLLLTMPDVEGVGELQRCYHQLFDPTGEWLHLNRLFGRSEAPPEVAAVDRLMQQVRPGLSCDLHEGAEPGFWLSVPRPEGDKERTLAMAHAFLGAVQARAYPITTYEEWVAIYKITDQQRVGPEPRLPGLLWTNPLRAGQGPNLGSYASRWGIAIDTEAPIVQPLAMRVDGITHGIEAAVQVWEETLDRV
ncbi:MAG TPA: hypothetical protein PKO09_10515 [Anaerolineae bacterium]|nr:hypothetical protein [Anaerolineae bacterium]